MVNVYYRDDTEEPPVKYDLTEAFVPVDAWRAAHPNENVPEDCLRHTRGRFQDVFDEGHDNEDLMLVFDSSHPKHQALLDKYRCDSRALKAALKTALQGSGLPVSVAKSGWRRLTINIFPPFLESHLSDEHKASRQQRGRDEMLISVHLDAKGVLQAIRSYEDLSAWDEIQNSIESIVARWFLDPSNDGDWDGLAGVVVRELHLALDAVVEKPLPEFRDLEIEWGRGLMPPKVALMRHLEAFLVKYGAMALSGYAYTLAQSASQRELDFSEERIMDYGQQILHNPAYRRFDDGAEKAEDRDIAV